MRPVTRRSVLAVGGAAATGALAGCSGGSDSPTSTQTPTGGSRPDSLAVDHFTFCAERPTGYRQYREQPEATYEPTDTVWVYFEPSTVGTEPAGEGQVRFEFTIEWTIYRPDGTEMDTLSRTAARTVPETADRSELFLWLDFTPSVEFDTGTYRVEIAVTDEVADNTASETAEFTVERALKQTAGSFGLSDLVFASEEPTDYREYTRQPGAEYGVHDDVWFYAEVDGLFYEETGGRKVLDLSASETLTGPEGETWIDTDLRVKNDFSADTDLSTYYLADGLSPTDRWIVGDYRLRIEVTDGYRDRTAAIEGTFTVSE